MFAEAFALSLALAYPLGGGAVYRPADRAVSNWRSEALLHLAPAPEMRARIATFSEPKGLPRCVRLNNYWCVKSAKWNGEIATDLEGHVAFASAQEGALVAAQLLRRYYVDLERKSARAIVSRWAPAECGFVAANPRRGGRVASGLAPRGIQNTLRAKWLASRGKGRKVARSRVPDRAPALMRAPSIAVGMGERPQPSGPVRLGAVRVASLGMSDAPAAREPAVPRIACAGEAVRIRNYAARVAQGVAEGPDADLKLFDGAGQPTPALARALVNMASVEIGPLGADTALVDDAVGRLREAIAARAVQAAPAATP